MSVRYLFNTAGEYVAFLQGSNVFSPNGTWLGFVKSGNQFYTTDGQFGGYVLEDDRVARNKMEPYRPPLPRPLSPLSPLRPLRPLKRLRKSKLQYPYEDVFERGIPGQDAASLTTAVALEDLEGSALYAADDTFLGKVTKNPFEADSIANAQGSFGNPYSSSSIFNQFAIYGNPYSQLSPFNEFSRTPPRFVKDEEVIGYLTVNQFISPRVDPAAFKAWLGG